MNLIPGAASSSEKAVLEQAAYQTSLYLPLHKWPPKKRSSLGTIIQTAYKEIVLLDQAYANMGAYYLPVLEYVDCLDPASRLTRDRSMVLEAVMDADKVGDRSIFYLGGVGNLYTVARLDIVESFLRRGATGIGLTEVMTEVASTTNTI